MNHTTDSLESPQGKVSEKVAPFDLLYTAAEQCNGTPSDYGHYWLTNCPGPHHKHSDRNPSLIFWKVEGDDHISTFGVKCYAGCSRSDIVQGFGLNAKTTRAAYVPPSREPIVTLFDLEAYTQIDWRFLASLGLEEGYINLHSSTASEYKKRGVLIPYHYEDGRTFEKARIRIGLQAQEGKKSARFKWGEGEWPLIAYGLDRLQSARDAGYIVIVEGESDCWTLWLHGIPALGIPGANNITKTLNASLLNDIPHVYVTQEWSDYAGINFPYNVQVCLRNTGYTGEVKRIPLKFLTGAKDPNELHKQLLNACGGKFEQSKMVFMAKFQEALAQAQRMDRDTGEDDESAPPHELPQFILEGQLREQEHRAMEILEQSNISHPKLFLYLSMLTKVVKDENGSPLLQQLDRHSLRHELSLAADFFSWKKGKEEPVLTPAHPPTSLAEQLLSKAPSDWRNIPALRAVVETPVLRPDGSILDKPGYDTETKLYYMPSQDMRHCKIPAHPTKEDALRAIAFLRPIFADFPFEGQADYANAFALLFTPFLRHAVKKDIQLALIDATNAGTGKGMLVTAVTRAATGKAPTPIAAKNEEAEWRKALLTEMISGPRIVVIDNIRGVLESQTLELILTSETFSERILGQSKNAKPRNEATWIATGNNLLIGGDLARRSYRIRLIANEANPDERDPETFQIPDLEAWITDHRSEVVAAILTICRAWYLAGKPKALTVPYLATFSDWAKTIGGILEFVGIQGFQQNRAELRSRNNEEAEEWEAFLSTWYESLGDEWQNNGELAETFRKLLLQNTVIDKPSAKSVYDVMPKYLKKSLAEKPNSFEVSLSIALGKRVQTVYGMDGYRLEKDKDKHTKASLWRVVRKVAEGYSTPTREENFSCDRPVDSHVPYDTANVTGDECSNPPQPSATCNSKMARNHTTSGMSAILSTGKVAEGLRNAEGLQMAQTFYEQFTSQPGYTLKLREDGRIAVGVPESMSDEEYSTVSEQILQIQDALIGILRTKQAS